VGSPIPRFTIDPGSISCAARRAISSRFHAMAQPSDPARRIARGRTVRYSNGSS
jgi:hypothetical protein